MTESPALVILAAGMGSRYGGLKQMDPMGPNGETVLDYSVFDAIRAGFSKVIFVIRQDFAKEFKVRVGSRFADRIDVSYAFQKMNDLPDNFTAPADRERPWGTAHAILAARHEIDRPFAVINADDFYGADAYLQAAGFLTSHSPTTDQTHGALVGYRIANTLSDHGAVNRGICTHKDGFLNTVEEVLEISRKDVDEIEGRQIDGSACLIDDDTLASMNFWAFPQKFINQLERCFHEFLEEKSEDLKAECYIPTVVDDLINRDELVCHILETSSSWFGVTYPADKPHVVATIRGLVDDGAYPSPLIEE